MVRYFPSKNREVTEHSDFVCKLGTRKLELTTLTAGTSRFASEQGRPGPRQMQPGVRLRSCDGVTVAFLRGGKRQLLLHTRVSATPAVLLGAFSVTESFRHRPSPVWKGAISHRTHRAGKVTRNDLKCRSARGTALWCCLGP